VGKPNHSTPVRFFEWEFYRKEERRKRKEEGDLRVQWNPSLATDIKAGGRKGPE
jgi:hypothetical protein